MNNENNTPYLFEWKCDCCLKDHRDMEPRICRIISRDRPGCGRVYLYYQYTRSLEPVGLPKTDEGNQNGREEINITGMGRNNYR